MNKQQLAQKIWATANKLRSKIEANDYKDYILGFLFYKFLSDNQERFLTKNELPREEFKVQLVEENTEIVSFIQSNLGYYISYKNLFSTWANPNNKNFQFSNVKEALSAFSRLIDDKYQKVFKDIFKTLDTGLSNLGTSDGERTKSVLKIITLIDEIPTDGKQDYDVLGFVYEYLIANFAANAGKKAGEFYTPNEVSILMSEIIANHLKDRKSIEIYDPTSGSGSLLINIGKSASRYIKEKDTIKYYAQELKENTYNLTRMNLIMRGILPDNIYVRNGDTLEDDWPYFEENNKVATYNPLYVDAVVSNPPYSQNWDPKDKDMDVRYKEYGLAPKSKADYAFLLHDLFHLKPDGIMSIVLPHGVLFRGNSEEQIRKNLIEKNKIDAVIGLPANIFFGTSIPTIILILKQKRDNTDILFIDASKEFIKVGKNNKLAESHIRKISDTYKNRTNIKKYSRVVTKEEIIQNNYNLNIPRYIDSSEEQENFDIYSLLQGGIPENEINLLNEYWNFFPKLKNNLFYERSKGYSNIYNDFEEIINNSLEIKNFYTNFNNLFSDFNAFLKELLVEDILNINILEKENSIANYLFEKISKFNLIDKYKAYQLFINEWKNITEDIEIIKSEGISSIISIIDEKEIKNIKGKEEEVIKGKKGLIIPFKLIQSTYFKQEENHILKLNERKTEINFELEEILNTFEEDEKKEFVNEDGNSFNKTELAKIVKTFKNIKIEEDSLEDKLIKADKLIKEEKEINLKIKEEEKQLELMVIKKLQNLTEEEQFYILEQKWINPIVKSTENLATNLVQELVNKVSYLAKKYETTLNDLEKEINETSNELKDMLNDLTGDEFDMQGIRELQKLLGEYNE